MLFLFSECAILATHSCLRGCLVETSGCEGCSPSLGGWECQEERKEEMVEVSETLPGY